ncbi:ScbA/BarX family gamma-butyrolactone biosynthesis protein [Streptomyces bullii]|uniref:ScbA/BarX family gamma-butyrolactone biosynthesis protein n=1 Tax=Streptomyces bullii TaxID=349910 RepID=A0ABW0UK82_9ACTN
MPQTGPLSAPTEDQTGLRGGPASAAGEAVDDTVIANEDMVIVRQNTDNAGDTNGIPHAALGISRDSTAFPGGNDRLSRDAPKTPPTSTAIPRDDTATAISRVTKELAHRTRESDVFPTHWRRLSDTRFLVTAYWPAVHAFFRPVDDRHQDPMVVGETLRQTSMALAHAEFGVPADTHFVMWDMDVTVDPAALLLADAAEPVAVHVVCSEIRRRGRGLSSMRTTMQFRRAGRLVARGTGSTGCTSPAAYRRLRARQLAAVGTPVPLPPGIPPELVGRDRAEDVVLAPDDRPGVWRLRVDTGHPVLFPRPNDHVPGMVLFEAARQAATAASGGAPFLPGRMSVSFSRYTELDTPCLLETEVLDKEEVTVRVSGVQNGESAFTATLSAAPDAPARSAP